MEDTRTRAEILAELEALRADVDWLTRSQHGDGDQSRRAAHGFSESINRFRKLIRSFGALMIEIDPSGNVVGCSATSVELLDMPAEMLIGTPFAQLVHPDEKAELETFLTSSSSEAPTHFRLQHRSGEWRHFDLQISSSVRSDGAREQLVFARDVTEMHNATVALQASEDRYRALAENATDLIVEIDAEGQFLYVSPNSLELIGYTPEQLLGSSVETILQGDRIVAATVRLTGL